jgi:hypothetical protein
VEVECTCRECGARFAIMSSTGGCSLCKACTLKLLEVIWGCKLAWHPVFRVVTPA